MPTFADAGPGPLIVPILGGLALAGVLLTIGIVWGGLWLVRRWRQRREGEEGDDMQGEAEK